MHLQGDFDRAIAAYEDVLIDNPSHAEAHNNAGAILAQHGKFARAIAHLLQAVEGQPGYADAHHNLGLALLQSGESGDAIAPLQRACDLQPSRTAWWSDLGNALIETQRCDEALAAYDRAVLLDANDVTAHSNRAIALRGLRRLDDALAACRQALTLVPQHIETLNNLGIILKERRDFTAAERHFHDAIAEYPANPTLRVNYAVLLMEMNRHDEAQIAARAIVATHPELAEPWNVLGCCALERADYDEAERCHSRALAIDPRDRNANWNFAVRTLLRGNFADGFRAFESRKRLTSVVFTIPRYAQPEWDGGSLDGKTIFVHAEQGLGDLLQFVRYAPLLKARGASRVIFESTSGAAPVMRLAPGVDAIVTPGEVIPPFDVHAYLMSLPLLVGTESASDIPAEVSYLSAPSRAIAQHVATLGRGLRVGLAWAGNPQHQRDLIRSVALASLDPVLATPGVTFFSLQKGTPVDQLADPAFASIVNLDPLLVDLGDTAAAIEALDLVITVDTAIAHLAGALGKQVWVLLPHVPDWRWMLGRDDTPWYPTMRLFRQPAPQSWAQAIANMADALPAFTPSPLSGARVTPSAMPTFDPPSATPASSVHEPAPRRAIEIGWPVGFSSGWGTYGLQLALALARHELAEPVLLEAPALAGVSPLAARRIQSLLRATPSDRIAAAVRLTGLGNHLVGAPNAGLPSDRMNAGMVFFEDTSIDAVAVARAHAFDVIVAGSTWNAEILKAFGVTNVAMVLQGVDPALFHPAPRTGAFGDRFHVFSGGKLEYRKGQDIVVEAFRRFHATHPDAVLVTSWHNHWPQTMAGVDAEGYVHGLPAVRGGRCEIEPWLVANGLPAEAVVDLGLQAQPQMAQVLREMDAAVFTNRCEGGTNLVAMEAMACGVPTILSANTGHLNLIGADTCFPLERQQTISRATPLYRSTFSWGESDPDEVVAALERIYDDRAEAVRRGAVGAQLLAQLPWSAQADRLLEVLSQ